MYANGVGTVCPQSSYRGVVAVSEEDVEKPLQLKPCKLLQPNVTTLTHVGGTLATGLNSPEIETQPNTTLHINLRILAATLYCSCVYTWCQWGLVEIKEVTVTFGWWKQWWQKKSDNKNNRDCSKKETTAAEGVRMSTQFDHKGADIPLTSISTLSLFKGFLLKMVTNSCLPTGNRDTVF